MDKGSGSGGSTVPKNLQLTTLKVGNIKEGNYTEIEADGTISCKGDATTWKDIVNSIIGRRLSANPGTLDYNWNENTISAAPSGDISDQNDRAIFNLEYNHDLITDGKMDIHVHWEQPDATERTFTIQYRIQKNGQPKTTTWTTVNTISTPENNKFEYVSGTLNQITDISDIDMTGAGLSATVQFRFTRSDANAGNIEIAFVDAHVEGDSFGSREEYVK